MTARHRAVAAVIPTLSTALKRGGRIPKRFSKAQKRDVKAALRWNQYGNILGFGVGPKRTCGKADHSTRALMIFVVRKLARSRLTREERIPRRLQLESAEESLRTDVIEVGAIPTLQIGPLRPGSDAAHFTMRDGTLTATVLTRAAPRRPFLLSCCHVFAPPGVSGPQIESPPDLSAMTISNWVADVAAFEPLRPGGNFANRIDAALAAPVTAALPVISNTIPGLGRVASASALQSGDFFAHDIRAVLGVGAMTPRTRGQLLAENVATLLTDPFGRIYLFQDVVAYAPTPITQPGDSGMPLFVNTPSGLQLVGMHIGLGRVIPGGARAAFFVPIAPVLDRFAVDLLA